MTVKKEVKQFVLSEGTEANLVSEFAKESAKKQELDVMKKCLFGIITEKFQDHPAETLPNGLVFEVRTMERNAVSASSELAKFLTENGAENCLGVSTSKRVSMSTRMKSADKEKLLERYTNRYATLGTEDLAKEWRECSRLFGMTSKTLLDIRDRIMSSPVFALPGKYIAPDGNAVTVSSSERAVIDMEKVRERFPGGLPERFSVTSTFRRIFSETPEERERRQENERSFAKERTGADEQGADEFEMTL